MAEVTKRSDTSLADWPALRVAEWTDTRDTLHMWTQIVGTTPVEVERAIPFEDDHEHAAYDSDAAHLFWRQLLQAHRVLSEFRSRFIGKVSPVHFFGGGFDMAVTRFSGRTAPTHPGGAPNVGDWVMVEPDGFRDHPIRPDAGYYSSEAGQFLLPYEVVHTAPDPDHTLLEFLQTTYEAAADHGDWDRDALEDDPARRASPR